MFVTLRRVLGSMAGALARLVAMAGLAFVVPTWAKETVAFDYAVPGDVAGRLQAVLRRPSDVGNGQALVLIHHAGGFGRGTTTPYAELFTSRGFTTLELRMFDSPADRPPGQVALYAMVASALRYLAQQPGVQPDKVSAMGLSLGAILTIGATSQWFYERHQLGALRFHRLAALYPVCWMMTEAAQGRTQGLAGFTGLPAHFLQTFAKLPLLILAGGKDNYDGSNPNACPDFAKSIPDAEQMRLTQVKVYPEATHGWDHGQTYSFVAFNACPMRTTCRNVNVSSPVTVEKGKQDLLAFFTSP
jgi:dienelactone hydrolase